MVDELKGGGATNAGGRDLVVVAGNFSPDDCRWEWLTPMLTE